MSTKPSTKTRAKSEQQNDDDEPRKMSLHAFRIHDDEWADAVRIAAERGDNLSEILRNSVTRYRKRHSS